MDDKTRQSYMTDCAIADLLRGHMQNGNSSMLQKGLLGPFAPFLHHLGTVYADDMLLFTQSSMWLIHDYAVREATGPIYLSWTGALDWLVDSRWQDYLFLLHMRSDTFKEVVMYVGAADERARCIWLGFLSHYENCDELMFPDYLEKAVYLLGVLNAHESWPDHNGKWRKLEEQFSLWLEEGISSEFLSILHWSDVKMGVETYKKSLFENNGLGLSNSSMLWCLAHYPDNMKSWHTTYGMRFVQPSNLIECMSRYNYKSFMSLVSQGFLERLQESCYKHDDYNFFHKIFWPLCDIFQKRQGGWVSLFESLIAAHETLIEQPYMSYAVVPLGEQSYSLIALLQEVSITREPVFEGIDLITGRYIDSMMCGGQRVDQWFEYYPYKDELLIHLDECRFLAKWAPLSYGRLTSLMSLNKNQCLRRVKADNLVRQLHVEKSWNEASRQMLYMPDFWHVVDAYLSGPVPDIDQESRVLFLKQLAGKVVDVVSNDAQSFSNRALVCHAYSELCARHPTLCIQDLSTSLMVADVNEWTYILWRVCLSQPAYMSEASWSDLLSSGLIYQSLGRLAAADKDVKMLILICRAVVMQGLNMCAVWLASQWSDLWAGKVDRVSGSHIAQVNSEELCPHSVAKEVGAVCPPECPMTKTNRV